MRRMTVLTVVILITPPCGGQDVVSLGVNPDTGLEEIRVNIAGLPTDATPLEMVLIPAGTFTMGSPSGEVGRDDREDPQHEVTITGAFYFGKYEVTQAQWESVMGSNPSYFSGKPNNPVEQVSWDDCESFIENLNGMGLGKFRLPTEAEWEYACRAGTTTRFYWGDDQSETQIGNYAWYTENNSLFGTKEVDLKEPNAWGLYDMGGNVYEWCQDWYSSYSAMGQTDPGGPESGSNRVLRGGHWNYYARGCRSAHRNYDSPGYRYRYFGLRLLRYP